jgi:imidazolonepropionase-like amidohydrolase
MRTTLLVLMSLMLGGNGFGQSRAPAKTLVLRNVTVIDGTGAAARSDMTVLVRDGRIAKIGKASEVVAPEAAQVVDGTGKFLIPGLWDMHGHLTDAGEGALAQLVENGVTGVRDLGGDLERVRAWRAEIDAGKRLGPHIVAAGPLLDGPTEAKWHVVAKNEAEARELVRTIKASGTDFLKTHMNLSKEVFLAAVDEAKELGMPIAVHKPAEMTIAEASDAGASSLEHVEMLTHSELYGEDEPAKSFDEAFANLNGEKGAALWAKLAKNGTYFVPTLVAYERGFVLWSNKPEAMLKRRPIHWQGLDVIGAMHRAGVKILAGTDFSDWGVVPGVDLHNELALLVEAGFSPMEALQAATLRPAEFLGRSKKLGTIEEGKIADLVLLDMDPLECISHTRKIRAVVLGGRYVDMVKMRDVMIGFPSTEVLPR